MWLLAIMMFACLFVLNKTTSSPVRGRHTDSVVALPAEGDLVLCGIYGW